MVQPKVTQLFPPKPHLDPRMEKLLREVEYGARVVVRPMVHQSDGRHRALMLAYKTGDRCLRCGNGAFHVGRGVATCANPRCELPVPLG